MSFPNLFSENNFPPLGLGVNSQGQNTANKAVRFACEQQKNIAQNDLQEAFPQFQFPTAIPARKMKCQKESQVQALTQYKKARDEIQNAIRTSLKDLFFNKKASFGNDKKTSSDKAYLHTLDILYEKIGDVLNKTCQSDATTQPKEKNLTRPLTLQGTASTSSSEYIIPSLEKLLYREDKEAESLIKLQADTTRLFNTIFARFIKNVSAETSAETSEEPSNNFLKKQFHTLVDRLEIIQMEFLQFATPVNKKLETLNALIENTDYHSIPEDFFTICNVKLYLDNDFLEDKLESAKSIFNSRCSRRIGLVTTWNLCCKQLLEIHNKLHWMDDALQFGNEIKLAWKEISEIRKEVGTLKEQIKNYNPIIENTPLRVIEAPVKIDELKNTYNKLKARFVKFNKDLDPKILSISTELKRLDRLIELGNLNDILELTRIDQLTKVEERNATCTLFANSTPLQFSLNYADYFKTYDDQGKADVEASLDGALRKIHPARTELLCQLTDDWNDVQFYCQEFHSQFSWIEDSLYLANDINELLKEVASMRIATKKYREEGETKPLPWQEVHSNYKIYTKLMETTSATAENLEDLIDKRKEPIKTKLQLDKKTLEALNYVNDKYIQYDTVLRHHYKQIEHLEPLLESSPLYTEETKNQVEQIKGLISNYAINNLYHPTRVIERIIQSYKNEIKEREYLEHKMTNSWTQILDNFVLSAKSIEIFGWASKNPENGHCLFPGTKAYGWGIFNLSTVRYPEAGTYVQSKYAPGWKGIKQNTLIGLEEKPA
jgi:hypothetical protein